MIAAVVLLGLASLWALGLTSEREQPQAGPAAATEEQEPAAPEAPVAAPSPTPPAAAPLPPVQAPPARAEIADPVAVEVPPHPRSAQFAALLEARFQVDEVVGSAPIEAELRRKITAALPDGSRIESIECRKAFCRVRSRHPDASTYQHYLSSVFSPEDAGARAWLGEVFIAVPSETPGPVTSSVYLGRTGPEP